ncbi:MAG: tetratricopeptide repeat protein [Cyclobacteriaceae bacterium]
MPNNKKTFKPSLILGIAVFWLTVIIYFACDSEKPRAKVSMETASSAESVLETRKSFVGEQRCVECHQDQYHDWEGSHHAFSMQPASSSNVQGNFDNAIFEKDGITYKFIKRDEKFWVNTKGEDNQYKDFEIQYIFGTYPLQQYLVELSRGRMQALETAWDCKKKKWFHLYDHLKLTHNEWVNWTGGAMNWNTMCAQCHSTYLEKNFDQESSEFSTQWTSVNVSCESCHGAGTKHIEYIKNGDHDTDKKVAGSHMVLTTNNSSKEQVAACAPCHSRRGQITKNYDHQGEYLDHFVPSILTDGLYHADGQIQDEVYVYGSFVQSKMYHNNVQCTNCHDPHTTKVKFQDNQLCLQCHEQKYDLESHHFHPTESEGAECINCHMPGKYYMGNDFRRDHSFRIPRPDLSVEHGTPNSCIQCHEDKSNEWADKQVTEWYGEERPYHFSETLIMGRRREPQYVNELVKMLADTAQPVIARATAVQYIDESQHPESNNEITKLLSDPEPLIRIQAIRSLTDLPQAQKASAVAPLLRDKVRAVRVAAADVLIDASDAIPGLYRKDFNKSSIEFNEYLEANADSRDGQFAFAQYYDRLNQPENAIKYYQKSLDMDSLFNMARLNLGVLYNRLGRNEEAVKMYQEVILIEPGYGPAYYSLGLLYAEMSQMDKTVEYLKKTIEVTPDNLRAYYNLGLALQNLNRIMEAEQAYLDGLKVAPEYWEIHNAIGIMYYQQGNFPKAKHHIDILSNQFPNNQELKNFLAQINAALTQAPAQ